MKSKVVAALFAATTIITTVVGCTKTTSTNPTIEDITTEASTTETSTTEEPTEEPTTELETTEEATTELETSVEHLPSDDYRTYEEIVNYYTEAGATYDTTDGCCHFAGTYSGITFDDVALDPRKFYEAKWKDTVKEINTVYFSYDTLAMDGKSLVKTDIAYGIFTSEEEFRKAYVELQNSGFDTYGILWDPSCHSPIFDEPHEYYILWDCDYYNVEIVIEDTTIDESGNPVESEKEGWSRVCPSIH